MVSFSSYVTFKKPLTFFSPSVKFEYFDMLLLHFGKTKFHFLATKFFTFHSNQKIKYAYKAEFVQFHLCCDFQSWKVLLVMFDAGKVTELSTTNKRKSPPFPSIDLLRIRTPLNFIYLIGGNVLFAVNGHS